MITMKFLNIKDSALSFFRIAVGGLLIIHHLAIILDFDVLFGFNALIPNEINNLFLESFIFNLSKLYDFCFTWLTHDQFLLLFHTVYLISLTGITVGILKNFFSLIALILHFLMMKNNVFFSYGVDYFSSIALFIIFIFPCNSHMSLDLKLGIKRMSLVTEKYFLPFLQVFLSILYFFSGFDKLLGYNWRNGEAIWKTINLPSANTYISSNLEWLSVYQLIPILLGWSVVVLEMLYFIINFTALRKFFLSAIIVLHLSIALLLELYFFSSLMIIFNIAAYHNFKTYSK